MLPLSIALAALVVAQVAILLPVADFLTRRLTGEQPAGRSGAPAIAQSI